MRELAVTAEQFCADVAKATGAKLACDVHIKDDLVVLVTKERPAREVMQVVADHFGWQWEAKDDGLVLRPSSEFSRKASLGRAPFIRQEGAAVRTEAQARLAAAKQQSPAAVQAEMEKLEKKEEEEGLDDATQEKIGNRLAYLHSLTDPLSRVALEAAAALTSDQLAQIVDDRVTLSASPGPLEQPFSESVQSLADRTLATLRKESRGQDANERLYITNLNDGGRSMAPPSESTILRVLIRRAQAHVTVLTANHEVVQQSEIELTPPEKPTFPPLPPKLLQALQKTAPDEPETKVWQEPLRSYARYMEQAARQLSVDLVSDAYDCYGGLAEMEREENWLDGYRESGFEPRIVSGWLSQRNAAWPRHREELAPRSVVKTIATPFDSMSLDERAAIAGKLAPYHVESAAIPFSPPDYWKLHLWAALPSQLRDELKAGRRVPLSSLPRAAWEVLYMTDPDQDRQFGFPEFGDEFDFESYGLFQEPEFGARPGFEPALQGFSTTDESLVPPKNSPLKRTLDKLFASMYPRFIDPKGYVECKFVHVPALLSPKDEVLPPQTLARYETAGGFSLETEMPIVDVEAYALKVHLREDCERTFKFTQYVKTGSIAKGRLNWPKDLSARVEKHAEEMRKEAARPSFERIHPSN